MKIWFHGTNADAAESIRREGFRVGTWLARNLQDALAFGGPWVFEVALGGERISPDAGWQIHTLEPIPPDRIVALTAFTQQVVFDNPGLRREVFESNADGSIDGFAGKVEGHRWPEPMPPATATQSGMRPVACP